MGHFLIAIAITANGLVGARYGIGYPVQSRAPFGFFFSYLMVVIRMIVGVFWYGVNTYTGAQCIYHSRQWRTNYLPPPILPLK